VFRAANIHRVALPLVIAMAIVAIAIPTCRMINCDMDMGKGMPFMPRGLGIFNPACAGEWVTSTGPSAIVPSGVQSLLLTLIAAVVAVVALFAPQFTARPVFAFSAQPPPPPESPRGERFRV